MTRITNYLVLTCDTWVYPAGTQQQYSCRKGKNWMRDYRKVAQMRKGSRHDVLQRSTGLLDKSLARPGRRQANVSVRMAWISFGASPCRKKKTWWQLASRCCWNRGRTWHASELVYFVTGLRTYQAPSTELHLLPTSLIISVANNTSTRNSTHP